MEAILPALAHGERGLREGRMAPCRDSRVLALIDGRFIGILAALPVRGPCHVHTPDGCGRHRRRAHHSQSVHAADARREFVEAQKHWFLVVADIDKPSHLHVHSAASSIPVDVQQWQRLLGCHASAASGLSAARRGDNSGRAHLSLREAHSAVLEPGGRPHAPCPLPLLLTRNR